MSSIPLPAATAPTSAPTHKAERPEKTERPERSEKHERTEKSSSTSSSKSSRREVSNDVSQDDTSFLSYLMGGLVNDQSFSLTSVDPADFTPVSSSAVSFGGTFNMDPSMLVLPEGIDAAALVASANGQVNFSSELLAALTPGVPTEIDALGVVDGQVMAQMEGDPRLIATGLDPAQMQALVARLAAMSADQANAQSTPAVSSQVAIVSFLPDQPVVDMSENAIVATPVKVAPEVSAPVVQAAQSTSTTAVSKAAEITQTVSATDSDIEINVDVDADLTSEVDGFDPLEFRLAAKPSRYGSVALPQAAANAAAAAPTANADAQANVNAAIKGVMQDSDKGDDAGSKLASGISSDFKLGPGTITTMLDPSLNGPALPATPSQSTVGMTNPVLQNISATQSHPATQAVANLINKAAQQGDGTKTLAIQLDPPELGKMQLKMKYVKGEPLRVHVVLEKADTMNMFQRDSHALQSALNSAGIQTDSSSLTFDFGGQGAFGDALQDQTGGNGQQNAWTPDTGAVEEPLQTQLSVVIDPKTGLAHYNLLV